MPPGFESGPAPGTPKDTSIAEVPWGEYFADPHLRALIDTSLQNNQELSIRLQEIIIANSEVMGTKGEYLPKVDAVVGAGADKVGEHTSQGRADRANGVPDPLADFRFALRASWEIDIWKKLRNKSRAAALRYLASLEGRKFVVTQLVAEIARSYYELIALDRQLEVLDENIAIQQSALEVVRLEKRAARVTGLAVQRFEAEVLKNRSRRFELAQRMVETENRLNFLAGRYPQTVARDAAAFDAPLPQVIETGVPTKLLENRPDVKQAELELSAAKLDVTAAKAEFYPSLSIEAGVGYESFNLEHLVQTPESLAFNVAGNLTAPLLNRRAIKAHYFASNARQLQAVYHYERALLSAFTDVANQLSRIDNLRRGYELESRQVELLTQSIETSKVLFRSARADYMEVLLTRRDALEAQMELIETKLDQLRASVDVYQALGGGWHEGGAREPSPLASTGARHAEAPRAQPAPVARLAAPAPLWTVPTIKVVDLPAAKTGESDPAGHATPPQAAPPD